MRCYRKLNLIKFLSANKTFLCKNPRFTPTRLTCFGEFGFRLSKPSSRHELLAFKLIKSKQTVYLFILPFSAYR